MKNLNDHAFIFDIDGTLVDLRQIWEQAYNFLYQKKHGFTLTDAEMKSMFGPPELECHTNILQGRQLYTTERAEELVRETEHIMLLTLSQTDVPRHIIPGAIPCLMELWRKKAALAVATGNIESIAKGILAHSGLQDYFPVVAYSSSHTKTRSDIVSGARTELERYHHFTFRSHRTYVIGDTPADVKAARTLKLTPVAIATGNYTLEELQQEKPDYCFQNLTEFINHLKKT